MTIEIRTDIASVVEEWDDLSDRTAAVPWLRAGWIVPWWSAFGRGQLLLATLRRGGRLEAAVPLGRRWGVLKSPSNWHTPAFGTMSSTREDREALVTGLFSRRPRMLSLYFLEREKDDLEAWRKAALAANHRVSERELERSPFVSLGIGWDAYEQRIPRKVASEIRRRRRKLEATGRLTLDIQDGSKDLQGLLEEGFRVEQAGWKGTKGTAIASSNQTREFYRRIAMWAASRGWLRLAFLRLDRSPMAFDYGIEFGGEHYLLKTGFDPRWQRFGPGMLLRYEMIKRAFEESLDSYEFLGRDDPWKLQWTNQVRSRVVLQTFASVKGAIDWGAWTYGRPAIKRVLNLVRK